MDAQVVQRAWAIKLGSGGSAIDFCENRKIIGIGWKDVKPEVLRRGDRDELWNHLRQIYPPQEVSDRNVGSSVGALLRFSKCSVHDYVLYYDPPKKVVRVCRVISDYDFRDFDGQDKTDIWYYRRVESACDPIPILDFYGGLKGKLLGPRGSFWELHDAYDKVEALVRGEKPHVLAAPDPALKAAYDELLRLLELRLEALGPEDWELLVVDYLKAQGAHVNESEIGGNRPIIDAEAVFDHGDLGEEVWRVQVKRYQDVPVDWPEIEKDFARAGDDVRFGFVSVFGFTSKARENANEKGIRLFEGKDFAMFILGNKLREGLQRKLSLPGPA
jgi:predicted Mrr-cat superfamily restriction endonuclease